MEIMRNNGLSDSKIILVCPGGKKTVLEESKEAILPCKVGDIFFCLNNICKDCYLMKKGSG